MGTTRLIIILRRVVVKIPNFTHSWKNFITGILSNITESQTWKYNSGRFEEGKSKYLCPVIWCSWGGWILIMQRADTVLRMDDGWEAELTDHMKFFPGDDKGPNYGMLGGRIVKIDYG